jgi:Holliday junction resolvasome RuvABC endonuclease subunit
MIYLGIDPGASGAAVAIVAEISGHSVIEVIRFSKATNHEIADWFGRRSWNGEPVMAVLEKVHSSPQMGVVSAFKFGHGYGFVTGVLTAIKVPFDLVQPQAWQKEFGLIMKGTKMGATEKKKNNRAAAERLFPNIKMTADLADALLLAEYCRRTHRRGAA